MGKQELGPNQLRWIEALESGEYRQGDSFLLRNGKYCCLGVGCEVFEVPRVLEQGCEDIVSFGTDGEKRQSYAPKALITKLGLRNDSGSTGEGNSLVGMNDDGKTFPEIAAFCRKHPEAVFTEPR